MDLKSLAIDFIHIDAKMPLSTSYKEKIKKILLLKRMEMQFVAMASTIQFCRVYLTLTPDRWSLSLDSLPLKAPNASHSSVFRIWGWTDSHVFVCPIYMSIALLSFDWFFFKHEVSPGKHTQACMCIHSTTRIHEQTHKSLALCTTGFQECWYKYPLVSTFLLVHFTPKILASTNQQARSFILFTICMDR